MRQATGRILTTHSGSLPRPPGFLPLVLAREEGRLADDDQFRTQVRAAVRETVRKQADAGVDVLNDGEVSKPSYATYVKDRLTGFGGAGSIEEVAASVMGLQDFPDFAEKMAQTMASAAKIRFTSCDGPVRYVGQRAVQSDIDNLKAAAEGVPAAATFMSAASPGVIAVFSPNRYYASQEEYLGALAEAMQEEYEAIHRAGLVLQLDCPDLAMTAPGAGSLENFRGQMELNVEALNHALANIPAQAEFRAWADVEYGPVPVVRDPAWLADEHIGAPSPHPRQVFAIGLNYAEHARESGYDLPATPVVFTKFPSCIVGPQHELSLPYGNVDWEVELVTVIGAHAYRIDEDQAGAVVAGLTVGQDLSERIMQRSGPAPQFGLAKSFPGFGPTGPVLVTPDEFPDPDDLEIGCRLGDETLQLNRTSGMVFGVPALVGWLSHITPLFPGDLIFTGTPSGIGMSRTPPRFLKPGDELVSHVEGIGQIRQQVVGSYAVPAPPRQTAAALAPEG